MRARNDNLQRKSRGGQTLIIALIMLGILLILGLVFLGLIDRNIVTSQRMQNRSVAGDLSEAGIRYAHSQLLYSALGADWHGAPTDMAVVAGFTRDPDVLYLRTGTNIPVRNDADTQVDLGGPDGLGPYTRIDFNNGRALVRVRYSPSDINLFYQQPTGALRNASRARNYLILESIGRSGKVTPNDPSSLPPRNAQVSGYGNNLQFRTAWQTMRTNDEQFSVSSKKTIAFASLGLIETARFFTDKYDVGRPAEIGTPTELGAIYEGQTVSVPIVMGASLPLFNFANPPTATAGPIPGFGSFWSNANLKVYGRVNVSENYPLGDIFAVAGSIVGADGNAALSVTTDTANPGTGLWQPPVTTLLTNASNPSLDSSSPTFSTLGGALRDGIEANDVAGYPRALAKKGVPSMLTVDPDTKQSRYVEATRESGSVLGNGNSGRYGHGEGVYVNNLSDIQTPRDENGRGTVGTSESLPYDWLNPNNGQANTGWQGPFYVPRGAFVQLETDGFIIIRDSQGPSQERTWRDPAGVNSGSSVCRFRIGMDSAQRFRIVNTFTTGINDINAALNPADYDKGPLFNGILYFEGNLRIRGIIPTDQQLTIVSNATIYVEGSITKGVFNPTGARIPQPSKSMLMLMARDYVALNTTQFFGTAVNQALEQASDVPTSVGYTPLRMRQAGGSIGFRTEFLLDPLSGSPTDPRSWTSYVSEYKQFGSNTLFDPVELLTTQTMDDGPASNTFLSLDINYGLFSAHDSTYLFPDNYAATVASPPYDNASTLAGNYPMGYLTAGFTSPNYINTYGLGNQPWQRYAKFETYGFPIIHPEPAKSNTGAAAIDILPAADEGTYHFLLQQSNDLSLRPNSVGNAPSNDYLLARAAVVPGDVRIEASMYAEEGSFFVIPGAWFNPNPNDRRTSYETSIANYIAGGLNAVQAQAAADRDRLESFGMFPEAPFYAEPIDVRVQIIGSVSENMPPPISQQAEWIKRWGWIPGQQGASGRNIPGIHVPAGQDLTVKKYVPNLIISYDPSLASGRATGFTTNMNNPIIRMDSLSRPLPPLPRLPVSPTLAYFGEVNP